MPKLTFSSDDLPRHLTNAARVSAWRDHFEEKFGSAAETSPRSDVPFHGSIEMVALNSVTLGTLRSSLGSHKRTKAGIAADGSDGACLIINLAPAPFRAVQNGREALVETGCATLFTEGATGIFESLGDDISTLSVRLPRSVLAGPVGTPEDHLMRPIAAASEPVRMLKSYAGMLMATGGLSDPVATQSVGSHLIDLVALSLGPTREAGEIAQRGLRAGRLNALLAEINAGFADPSFSAPAVARRLRMSIRYLYDLLHETGTGFGERVLELRLQNAWRLLSLSLYGHRKVTDIAFTSGFSDISYFNRCFRARFGITPSDARAIAATSGWEAEQSA
jgi:AraC-like DNA-binding protein